MKRILVILALMPIMFLHSYAQRTEESSWYVKGYTEEIAKKYFESRYKLDAIEGIWQSTDGYKYAIERDVVNGARSKDSYRVIILESSVDQWSPTEIKGFVTYSSLNGIYSLKYYTKDSYQRRVSSQNTLLAIENEIIISFHRIDTGDKIQLFRLYPKATQGNRGAGNSSNEGKSWTGSCIAIGNKYFATNHHVVDGAKSLMISGPSDNHNIEYTAEVVTSDETHDLAIIKVTDPDFTPYTSIPYGFMPVTSDVGSDVFVLGYPYSSHMGKEVKLTTGVISSRTGFEGNITQYQISAPVQPGNSGGPLFDNFGNLIGLVNSGIPGADNVGYAIKLSYLKILVESCNIPDLLTSSNTIAALPLTEKVKKISPYVFLVMANAGYDTVRAVSSTGDIISNNDNDKAKHYLKGAYQMIEEEKYDEAISFIEKSIEAAPSEESHYLRARVYTILEKEFEKVAESAQYCINQRHNLKDSYVLLAYANLQLEKYEECIKATNECLRIDRRSLRALFYKAQALSALERRAEAKASYLDIIKYDGIVDFSLYYYVYNNLAYMHLEDNDLDNAIKYVNESIRCTHLYGNAWDTYGEIMYKQGKYQDCIKYMNNAIILAQDGDEHWLENSHYHRGLSYKALGFDIDAYNDLQIAYSLNNEDAKRIIDNEFSSNNGQSCKFSNMYKSPLVKETSSGLTLQAVETTDECTILYMHVKTASEAAWIDRNAYIYEKDTDTKHKILKVEGIGFEPTAIRNRELSFVLIFPAISKQCTEFDFKEGGDSENIFYITEILLSENANQLKRKTAKGKEYTFESAIAEMQSIKIEVDHTTNKADLKILEEAVNTIDRWYFDEDDVNRELGNLIRETKKAIKAKLQ
mgnify:CR=1 FL=1